MEIIEQEPLSERDKLINKILYQIQIQLPLDFDQAMIIKRSLEYTYDIAFFKADSMYMEIKGKENMHRKR